jgi:uncharacterized membrane protein
VDALLRIAVQWLHVVSGILWIGGGFYTIVVQLPAVLAMPPAARGPAMAQIVPRQFRYILRVAELTIFWGVVNVFVSGRAQQLLTLDSRWAWSIIVGTLGAIFIYALVRARLGPWAVRMLELGPKAAGGDASAAAEQAALMGRIRRLGYLQLGVGILIVLAMVIARFS